MKLVGKPDAGNPHVRFDERGRETGCCQQAQATAPFLDSTRIFERYLDTINLSAHATGIGETARREIPLRRGAPGRVALRSNDGWCVGRICTHQDLPIPAWRSAKFCIEAATGHTPSVISSK